MFCLGIRCMSSLVFISDGSRCNAWPCFRMGGSRCGSRGQESTRIPSLIEADIWCAYQTKYEFRASNFSETLNAPIHRVGGRLFCEMSHTSSPALGKLRQGSEIETLALQKRSIFRPGVGWRFRLVLNLVIRGLL
jgi:hypothetical protein